MCAAGSHEITRDPSGKWMIAVGRPGARHHVAVGELHALGRPGRARGVDERDEVVGLDRRQCGSGVEAGVGALDVGPVRRVAGPAPPSRTITVSSAGSSARAAPNGSRNAASTIATFAAASPTT